MATTTKKKKIDQNQNSYLTNMVAGKTATGGKANVEQQNWAKSELSKSSYVPALNSVKQSVTQSKASTPAVSTPSTVSTVKPQVIQPTSRTNQTLNTMAGISNADPFQFKAPEAFNYDYNTDPAYQAALASARDNIGQQQADTNARLRATGQGKSSYSETVANQIGAKEMGRVSNEVLPQLIGQAYQRYADNANRDLQVQQANYGAGQDRLSNLANLYGLQNQQDFSNPLAESQVTGNYLSGEARNYMDAIIGLKQQAEATDITAEARTGLSQQADAYRAALRGLGVDPSLFGANINANTAMGNIGGAGARTLDGQALDSANRQANLNAALAVGDSTGKLVTPTSNWGNLFAQAGNGQTPLNLAGQSFAANEAQRATDNSFRTQQAAIQQAYQDGQLSLDQARLALSQLEFSDTSARQWAGLDFDMASAGGSAASYDGMSPNQVYDALSNLYMTQTVDQFGTASGPKSLPKDAATREKMYLSAIDSGLPDQQTDQLLAMLGLSKDELDVWGKKYGVTSGK
ncbi:MAG: hypothetical protein ACE3L7_25525 [Candidatus Pristimantibacillus sp.]